MLDEFYIDEFLKKSSYISINKYNTTPLIWVDISLVISFTWTKSLPVGWLTSEEIGQLLGGN